MPTDANIPLMGFIGNWLPHNLDNGSILTPAASMAFSNFILYTVSISSSGSNVLSTNTTGLVEEDKPKEPLPGLNNGFGRRIIQDLGQ